MPLRGVYPRVCGEAPELPDLLMVCDGLSPRVRGSRTSTGRIARSAGSIPACAGKPKSVGCPACLFEVYPRVCGEAGRESNPPRER